MQLKKILLALALSVTAALAHAQTITIYSAPITIPLGNFSPGLSTNANATTCTNSDGTLGVCATNFANDSTYFTTQNTGTYRFCVYAYMTANPGLSRQNQMLLMVDQQPIPADGAAVSDYWSQFVNNSSPSVPYCFTIPLLAGSHPLTVGFMISRNQTLQDTSQGIHADKIVITQVSNTFPAEPAGTRDPFNFPGSSNIFLNTPIGTGATASSGTFSVSSGTYNSTTGLVTLTLSSSGPWSSGSNIGIRGLTGTGSVSSLDTLNVNAGASTTGSTVTYTAATGLGSITITGGTVQDGDEAQLQSAPGVINSSNFSTEVYQGQSTDPVGAWETTNSVLNWTLNNGTAIQYLHMPGTIAPAPGSDQTFAVGDAANPRYIYGGFGGSIAGTTAQPYAFTDPGAIFDSYGQNNVVDEIHESYWGVIRPADITAGAINHTLLLATQYSMMAQPPTSYGGLGWPVVEADYVCAVAQPSACTGNITWGSFVYIPQSVNCSAQGFTADGVILCQTFQNFGAIQAGNAGSANNPQLTLYADATLGGNSHISNMAGDFASSTFRNLLRFMRNNLPTSVKGGGSLVTSRPAGLQQGYPAITWLPQSSPNTFPTIVAGQLYYNNSGVSVVTTQSVPRGCSVFVFVWGSYGGSNTTFSPTLNDSAGNAYSSDLSTPTTNYISAATYYSLNISNPMPVGTTIPINYVGAGRFVATVISYCGVNGGHDQVGTVNSPNAQSFSFSTGGSLAQSKELAFCSFAPQTPGNSIPSPTSNFPFGNVSLGVDDFFYFLFWEITTSTTAPTCSLSWSSTATGMTGIISTFKIP